MTCPTCNGARRIPSDLVVESLEHFTYLASVDFGCDFASVADFATLWSANTFRRSQALAIGRLLLSSSPATLANPSGWLATQVKDSWHAEVPANWSPTVAAGLGLGDDRGGGGKGASGGDDRGGGGYKGASGGRGGGNWGGGAKGNHWSEGGWGGGGWGDNAWGGWDGPWGWGGWGDNAYWRKGGSDWPGTWWG